MKRKSLLIMLLVALFVPLAMNAQTRTVKRSATGSPQLEMRVTPKAMPSNPMLTKLESAKEAALEELNNRAGDRGTTTVTASRITSASATWTGSGGESWSVAITGGALNQTVTNGYAQYGTRQSYSTKGTFSTSGISGTITSIAVDCASYNGAGTVSVTVGNAAFGSSQTIPSWTGTAGGTRTFTGSASGNIIVTMTNGTTTHRAMYIKSITVTYEDAGCSAPEDFAASNVTTNSVTLSWTETGTSEEWAILYMCEEDEEAQVEFTTTNPYTLTGLNPNTYYIAEVIPMCGDYDQESDVVEFTTEDLPCPQPTNLNASSLTPSSATVSWSGEADSYTLQYRPAADNGDAGFSDDFEDAWLDSWDWTTYTQGDAFSGYGWFAYSPDDFMEEYSPGAHSGSVCAMAVSYGSNGALNANNYLVTPQVELGGTLKFWMWGDYEDEYEVLLSTGGNAIRDFTVTLQAMQAAPYNTWGEISIDLSRYAGQQGYIAIHHVMYDGDVIMLDDFAIYGDAQPASAWETIENVTSPYTITGLDGETTYEWQVQGDCGTDGESLWSAIGTFTTPTSCGAPSGLTTTNITGTSATLNWAEVLDEYNVTYTKGFVYDFESAEPWAVDSFDPCTTYDGDQTECYGFDGSSFTNFPFTGSTIAFQSQGGNLSSHSGNAFGLMVCPAPTSSTSTPPAANDWFILPEIAVESGDVFSFWAREITTNYGAEVINVGVYGTSNGTFSSYLAQNVQVASTEWEQYSYDLSAYAGQTIRLAINYVSTDIFGFMFDDIFVGNPNWSDPITVTGATYTLTGLSMNTDYVWQVQGVNCDGEGGTTDWSSASFTTLDGILVESISADDVEVVVGGTANITNLVVLPADATNPAVTYTSGNEAIATVTDAGVVTGVAVGTTTITIAATDGSNVSTTINVTVTGIDVTGITAEDVEVVTGETATITYTVDPANASDQSVTFTSANTAIATVDANGEVTGVAAGTTTITLTSVSNPEVETTINVTVTSNPNAAQFTVNAPATAHPGDVITVDFVLAAPTAGTYTGFTGLDVNLYFETAAFQYNSKTNGAVADAVSAIEMSQVVISGPNTNNPNRVRALLVTPANTPVTTEGIVFSATFTVLQDVALGSYTFDATVNEFDYTIDLYNVVDIPYQFTPSTVNITTVETYTKPITGWASAQGNGYNYYLIASPLAEDVDPSDVTNMIANTANEYDLYYFDQAGDANGNEWINYKANNFELENGKGYLYANKSTVDLVFTGAAPTDNEIKVTLDVKDCSNASGHFVGWNLVGNPFGVTAYIDRDCYKMNTAGSEIIAGSGNSVDAMEGIFVIATTDGEKMTFSKTNTGSGSKVVMNVIDNQGLADRAIVRFGEGSQLPKFQLFGNSTKVYFPEGDQDYAVVRSANENELPVNFKASSNGSYTMSVNVEELDMDYLHLIDNLTGMDVDLLQTPSYTFEATTSDNESRFRLVFATVDSVNEHSFGFVNASGNFCIYGIEGEATVQVIDVLGHVLSSETFSGSYEKHLDVVPGVYMIRLIQGNESRVQKMVVR